jgi:hypothetical protein
MAYKVQKVNYSYLMLPSRAGHGVGVLNALKEAGVNLLAFSGFPSGRGKSQFDLVTDEMAGVKRVAKAHGWRLSKPKQAFLVQGDDVVGAACPPLQALADRGINVTAADAVTAGGGRFGLIFWVKPKDYRKAARALGV